MVLPMRQRGRLVLLLVWLVSAAYVFPFRLRGWTPHDEGVLALEAQYVLDGEMPHRDFPEIYTGGFSYWNALVFRVFGVRMISPRLALFLCFLAIRSRGLRDCLAIRPSSRCRDWSRCSPSPGACRITPPTVSPGTTSSSRRGPRWLFCATSRRGAGAGCFSPARSRECRFSSKSPARISSRRLCSSSSIGSTSSPLPRKHSPGSDASPGSSSSRPRDWRSSWHSSF